MRKNWWLAIQGIIIAILSLVSFLSLSQENEANLCNNNITDMYQEKTEILIERQDAYSWMHYLQTLKGNELIENDTFWAKKYGADAGKMWDSIAEINNKEYTLSRKISSKYKECMNKKESVNSLLNLSFIGYSILITVSLIIYNKTKE